MIILTGNKGQNEPILGRKKIKKKLDKLPIMQYNYITKQARVNR
jgi:hypothetical protein